MTERHVYALDLGSTKVVCIAVTDRGEGPPMIDAIARAPCKGLQRGVVADLDETSSVIDQVVREVQGRVGRPVEALVTGVGGAHLEGQNAQGFVPIYPRSRAITREDVLQVVNHSRQLLTPPDREQLQAITREFRIDGQRGIQRPIGMNGAKLEVVTHLVTGQTTHVQNVEKAVQMAGRKVAEIVAHPLASAYGVLTEEEMQVGAVVVDIGGGVTDVAVFSGGALAHLAVVPVAGQLVTSDLSKLLKAAPEEAERLKLQYGAARSATVQPDETVNVVQIGQPAPRPLQRRVLCEIIESRVREIAQLVRQQVERSGLIGMLPAGIVITGGSSELPEIGRVFEEVFGQRVRLAAPRFGAGRRSESPALATAIGLAAYALEEDEDEVSPASGIQHWAEKIRGLWSAR
jgi:cell division protein FtsA